MNAEFPRLITLLRKEKLGISQKEAAENLGISQALLSHYEKGIRECGLDFVIKCAKFYNVSCDYLLGLCADPQGNRFNPDKLPEHTELKDEVYHGNVMPVMNKKLINNSISLIYDLVGQTQSEALNDEITKYLASAVYQAYRILHKSNPKNEDTMFSIPENLSSAYTSAAMSIAEAQALKIVSGGCSKENQIRELDQIKLTTDYLMENYPLQAPALLNLIFNLESNTLNKF